jgi:hypothetical protein
MSAKTPEQVREIIKWRNKNHQVLRNNYRRQFIACGAGELLAAGTDIDVVTAIAEATGKPYIIDWIPALTSEFQFYWIKFYGMARREWQPLYPVRLSNESNAREILMVVDSGAELSLISREIGDLLGFSVSSGEPINVGQGVGGEIEYVNRLVDLTIDDRKFQAPVAWLLTEITNAPLLLGREVVFDLFDIKFVQAEERIEFTWRDAKPSD